MRLVPLSERERYLAARCEVLLEDVPVSGTYPVQWVKKEKPPSRVRSLLQYRRSHPGYPKIERFIRETRGKVFNSAEELLEYVRDSGFYSSGSMARGMMRLAQAELDTEGLSDEQIRFLRMGEAL